MDTMGGHLRGRDDAVAADPLRGALLSGRYRIMGRIARGSTTTVYQARDERLDRSVAIRIVNPEHVLDVEVLERVAGEAQTVAHLPHPNIVAVFDQGSYEGAPFVVMEYVHGRTLREVVADRGRLDPAESLAILDQVLAALAVAHRSGLVHRGIRPENILVAPPPNGSGDLIDAVVKVADFGLARTSDVTRSHTGPLLATAPYLAPEVITNGRADTRSDVYSAGIVLFEMLTGRLPFGDGGRRDPRYPGGLDPDEPTVPVSMRHVEEEVPPPSRVADGIPIQLDEIVVRATRRDPWARPRDAAGLLGQIQATREDVAALAGPTQAIAHPTMVVSPVRRADPRPARLPEQRASGRAGAGMGARVQGTEPPPDLGERMRDGISGFGGWLRVTADRLRYTARGRRQLTAGLVVLALVILGGGYWLAFGRYTQAPDLTQLTRDSAELEARLKGFDITIGESLFSEVVEPGRVLGQQPPPGGRIVRGGTITLFLSKGPDRRAIPDVTGQQLEFALTRLCGETTGPGQCQFVIEQVDGFSDTLPLGYVAGTDPPAGTMLAPGDRIRVIVVTGPFPMHVPGVLGDTLEDAINTLNAAGFTDVVVEQRASDEPKDRVLDQTPPAETGVEQAAGVQVTLVVSLGPALPMPNFIDPPRDCQEALNELAALGVIGQTTEPVPAGAFVTAQSVQPGAALTVGQTVDLTCVH